MSAKLPAAATPAGPGRYRTDVLVVGAGVAGLYACVNLPRSLDVLVLDKGEPVSGSSSLAQGGMAVALGADDSPELHASDTVRAGDGLCDPAAVRVLTREGPDVARDLLDLGARFDTLDEGAVPANRPTDRPLASSQLHLAREGGQSVARSLHRADATGAEMVRTLREAARDVVQRLSGVAIALASSPDGHVTGVWALTDDGPVLIEARSVLLATGGCGGLYAATTNRDHATGDGVSLAYLAGAAVRDNEFVQFHPTGLAVTGSWRLLLTEALRGAGATLVDARGDRFMVGRHPDAELAPRHVVAKAIIDQADGAWLDATQLGEDRLDEEFPTVLHGARRHGFDLATERVPVTPAAHYMVGGVRTDLHGRASLPGLYAAGEVASTGAHGANRMAGNSLVEALVFGRRAARAIASDLPDRHGDVGVSPTLAAPPPSAVDLEGLRTELRQTTWAGAGPIRSHDSLTGAVERLDDLAARLGPASAERGHAELRLAVVAARLIATSALLRRETRGGHVREDHPVADPAWSDIHLERVAAV